MFISQPLELGKAIEIQAIKYLLIKHKIRMIKNMNNQYHILLGKKAVLLITFLFSGQLRSRFFGRTEADRSGAARPVKQFPVPAARGGQSGIQR